MDSSFNSYCRIKAQTAGGRKWKAGGRFLVVLLIPIEKDTGGGVEIELVALL